MKIVDKRKREDAPTLDDASAGDVVRLKNGKLYLVSETYQAEPGFSFLKRQRLLTNIETGRTHKIVNGERTSAQPVEATLEVE